MGKKLTAATINKLNKELDIKKTVYILGDNEVNIDIVFKKSKIDKVVSDYLSLFEEVHKEKEIDEDFIRGSVVILNTFILREFSDVPMIPKDRDMKKLIQVSEALYDTGIMEEIIASFDEEELGKVYKQIDVSAKRVGEVMTEHIVRSSLSDGDIDENSKES